MRFDLTYAAYRAIDRAAGEQLPMVVSTEITAAKLLIALFNEEDCRAALWLGEAGLSLIQFRDEFDLDLLEKNADYRANDYLSSGVVQLQLPISAPSFQAGSYGIPAEAYSVVSSVQSNSVKAIAANPNSATTIAVPTDPDGGDSAGQYHPKKRDHKQDVDELILNENKPAVQTSRRYYSLFSVNAGNVAADARGNTPIQTSKRNHWFYVDDQPVSVAQLSAELESAIEIIALQCRSIGSHGKKIPTTDGGVRTIETADNIYTSSQPLATEHLLLAVSMDSADVGMWLSDHGLDSTTVREQIAALNNRNYDVGDQFNRQFKASEFIGEEKNFASDNFDSGDSDSDKSYSDKSYSDNSELSESDQLSYKKVYRLFDAVANRASEAVRAIEDYARFVIDDQNLTRKLKDFRHKLQTILSPIDFSKRLAARETENDIGREIEAENEYGRDSVKSVVDVNFSRLQESLRSIEEFSKIEYIEIARQVEKLRYQSYILHKEFSADNLRADNLRADNLRADNLRADNLRADNFSEDNFFNENSSGENKNSNDENLSSSISKESSDLSAEKLLRRRLIELITRAKLYVLIDCMEDEFIFRGRVQAMLDGGVDVIQIRDKSASDKTILGRCSILRELVGENEDRVLIVVNDRPDLARLSGADGVHVGQDDLSVLMAREILGNEFLVGVSTHNVEQIQQAVVDGADYIGVGPVFESATKSFESLAGLKFLKEAFEFLKNSNMTLEIPVFAIGGINESNIEKIIETGFSRVAVSKSIQGTETPKQAAENLKNFLIKNT